MHLSPLAVATICCVTGWAGANPCCHSAAGGAAGQPGSACYAALHATACHTLLASAVRIHVREPRSRGIRGSWEICCGASPRAHMPSCGPTQPAGGTCNTTGRTASHILQQQTPTWASQLETESTGSCQCTDVSSQKVSTRAKLTGQPLERFTIPSTVCSTLDAEPEVQVK